MVLRRDKVGMSEGSVPVSSRVFIIAEVGSTHDGSFGNARAAIDVVADCGADAVKFQTHIAEAETIRGAPTPSYFRGEPRYDYFRRTGFTREQWKELKAYTEEKGLVFMSSPFSEAAVDLLQEIGMEVWKIPSGEVTNLPMLEKIARTGKPVLLSSGMSSWAEVDEAVETIVRHHRRLTVLQCTTEYPCPPEEVGLNVMVEMKERYGLPVGLSDHTLPNYAIFAAVALGASAVEKHVTLSRRLYGSDARHSAEPEQFADLVRGIRDIEAMLAAQVDKSDAKRFAEMKDVFQKSVVAVVDIPKGAVIQGTMLGIKKPGTGIPAKRFGDVVGKRSLRAIKADTVLTEADVPLG